MSQTAVSENERRKRERLARHLEALQSCEERGLDPDLWRCDVCGAVTDNLLVINERQYCEFCEPELNKLPQK